LLASAEGYTPRATQLLEAARERLGTIQEVAGWIAESLPQPKTGPSRSRRRRRRKKRPAEPQAADAGTETPEGTAERPAEGDPPAPKRRRRRRKPAVEATTPPDTIEDAA
jgi:hypothetical protein